MSEVINTNKYLDFGGLKKYDELIKQFIANGNNALADAIAALDSKIGAIDIEGSDDKSIAAIVSEIYASIAEIVEKQDSLDEKDAELEGKIEEEIGKIVGDLNSLEEGVSLMTLVEVANKLKALDGSVSKNAQDIVDVKERVSAVEEAIKNLGEIEGGESLGEIVSEVKLNTAAIATLKGDENAEGSVKKAAKDAADAAQAAAEANAKIYADSLATNYDAAGAAADAQAAAEANAKAHAESLVNNEDGSSKFDAAGTAEQALEDAMEYADEKAGANAELIEGLSGRIGSLEGIAHAANVVYNEDTKYINIVDKDGNVIGNGFDASPFIVDGMLDGVGFEEVEVDGVKTKTNNLVFTFNTSAGKENVVVDFTKYVDIYQGDGSSIELNSETKTFSVKEVDASKTKLSTSIEVNGGPLADDASDNWPWKEGDKKVIPAGKTMEEILTSLFLKVTNGTVTKGSISWSPSLSAPTVSITQSGTVEVGTKLTATANTTNTVSGNTRSCTFTCKPGHFLSTGTDEEGKLIFGSYVSGNKTVYANAVEPATDGTPSIKTYWNGTEVTNVNGETEYTVSIVGTNTFKVDQSGVKAYAGKIDDITVYGATNTKVPVESVKASISGDTAPAAKDLTSTASATVTGARAYWMGSVKNAIAIDENNVPSIDGDDVRDFGESETDNVTKTLGSDPTTTVIAKKDDASVIIATQKEIEKINSENQINADVFGNFGHKEVNIDGANGYTPIKYHVYVWTPANVFAKDDTLTITYKK